MHYSDSTSPSAPSRLFRLAVCALLPAVLQQAAAENRQRWPNSRSGTLQTPASEQPASSPASTPYLLVCLPPPLRFARPIEPAPSQPVKQGPPHPGGLMEEIAALNQQAAMTTPPATPPNTPSPKSEPAEASATNPAPPPPATTVSVSGEPLPQTTPPSAPPAPASVGVTILPDDTPRPIRAEDVLVFFQFPTTAPANIPPPPSSATFRQQ